MEIVNTDIKGTVHQDRKLITADSPFASNNLGKAAAEALLAEYGAQQQRTPFEISNIAENLEATFVAMIQSDIFRTITPGPSQL